MVKFLTLSVCLHLLSHHRCACCCLKATHSYTSSSGFAECVSKRRHGAVYTDTGSTLKQTAHKVTMTLMTSLEAAYTSESASEG